MRILLLVILIAAVTVDAKRKELDYASLEKDYNNLVFDEKYKAFAKPEKQTAKKQVEALINHRIKRKFRDQALYLAKHSIAYARLVAEHQWIEQEIIKEQEIAGNYQIKISKTEAELARHDAALARLMLIAQQEEVQRAKQRAVVAETLAQQRLAQAQRLKKETAAAKRYAEAQTEQANLARQEAELALEEAESLREKINAIATKQTKKGLMMTLGDFVFASGKATIKPAAMKSFDKVVTFINTHPNKQVQIEGHTDSSGSAQLNLILSQRRADAVKALLVQSGIGAKRIKALGMGEEFPVANNSTSTGKAKNRRVEIIILQ